MNIVPYTTSGLDNIFVDGPSMRRNENGEEVVLIRSIGRLHRAIAEALVRQPWTLLGTELRFLRTEIGEDPETFSETAGLDLETLVAVETDRSGLDAGLETDLRHLAIDRLDLPVSPATVAAPRMARPSPAPSIVIEATGERSYAARPVETAQPFAERKSSDSSLWRRVREGVDFLVLSLDGLLGAGPAPAAGYRRGTSAAEPALPEEVPFTERDIWRPLLPPETKAGYWFFHFRFSGGDTPVEPALDLRIDGAPAEGKVLFRPEEKKLMVRFVAPGSAPETLEVATPDEATLAVRISTKA